MIICKSQAEPTAIQKPCVEAHTAGLRSREASIAGADEWEEEGMNLIVEERKWQDPRSCRSLYSIFPVASAQCLAKITCGSPGLSLNNT